MQTIAISESFAVAQRYVMCNNNAVKNIIEMKMTLMEFIVLLDKSVDEVAKELNTTAATVSRWQNGKSIPTRQQMTKIMHWSRGNVMPNDFYSIDVGAA